MAEIEINDNDARKQYIATASQTVFPYDFPIFDDDHIVVKRTRSGTTTTLTKTTDYTVGSVGVEAGGNVTLTSGAALDDVLTLYRDVPVERTADFTEAGDFLAVTLNRELDLITMMLQQMERNLDRSVTLDIVDTTASMTLPLAEDRASMFLAFDASGNPVASAGTSGSFVVSSFITTLLDDTTELVARATLGAMGPEFIDAKGDIIVGTAADAYARKAVGSNGTLLIPNSASADGLTYLDAHFGQEALIGGYVTAAVSDNALTFSVKTNAGNDPSTTEPVYALFRSATAGTAGMALLAITAATSLTISSGSTLGTSSGVASRTWCVGFNDAGTFRLGAINCSTSTNIYPLSDNILASSTAEGGAGAADSAGVIYTGTAVTAKPMRVLGYAESTQATAGTWATTPSKNHARTSGSKLPGDLIQVSSFQTGAVAAGTTVLPEDDTIPQSGEGVQFMSLAITPTGAINHLEVSAGAHLGTTSASATSLAMALFRDSVADALCVQVSFQQALANKGEFVSINHRLVSDTASAVTMKIRAGTGGAGTTTFNGENSARLYGGAFNAYLTIKEVMA